jgi:hypothetical protein
MSNGRKVSTDALETLGTIIDDTQKRDAIHLAVEPVIAGELLDPSDHVNVTDGVATLAQEGNGLGIVDPFLLKPVRAGERFWFVMYPRMVTSLRHVWAHPAFPDAPSVPATTDDSAKASAEQWIKDYAKELNVGFRDLIESARYWIETDDYMSRGSVLEGQSTSPEFWEQYAIYTGEEVPEDKRGNFFSCSC